MSPAKKGFFSNFLDSKKDPSMHFILVLGLALIFVFLVIFYVGPVEKTKQYGLLGQKKQQEQPAEARVREITPTILLNETNPYLGSTVTLTTTYAKTVKSPRIAIRCFQGEKLVYAEAGTYDHGFLLGGGWSEWLEIGGPAHCTAELFYIIWHGNNPQEVTSLALTSFEAAGAQ